MTFYYHKQHYMLQIVCFLHVSLCIYYVGQMKMIFILSFCLGLNSCANPNLRNLYVVLCA